MSFAQQCVAEGPRFVLTVKHALIALERGDTNLALDLHRASPLTDDDFAKVFDVLDRRPNAVVFVRFGYSYATDTTGLRLAAWIAKCSSVREVVVPHNKFGVATFLAVADAMSVNTSVRVLVMLGNPVFPVEYRLVVTAFERALHRNSRHPVDSVWRLFDLSCLLKVLCE